MEMLGWIIPPPKKPQKTEKEFLLEREEKVAWLIKKGLLRSEQIKKALLKVHREDFILGEYRDYAYLEVPLPIPGKEATISCPHSYPLFYEPLGLKKKDKFLEIGSGSGYGAAVAREIVGKEGLVVTLEIDKETYEFAKANLRKSGYRDVLVILTNGSLGYLPKAPYEKICITASCPQIPQPLIEQLKPGGRLISPVGSPAGSQDLILLEKKLDGGLTTTNLEKVLYVPLRGRLGWLR